MAALEAEAEAHVSASCGAEASSARSLRTLEGFTSALLKSQQYATAHSLIPEMLRTATIPPQLSTDEPPPPDAAARAFDAPWTIPAIKSFLAERGHGRRRMSIGGGPM